VPWDASALAKSQIIGISGLWLLDILLGYRAASKFDPGPNPNHSNKLPIPIVKKMIYQIITRSYQFPWLKKISTKLSLDLPLQTCFDPFDQSTWHP